MGIHACMNNDHSYMHEFPSIHSYDQCWSYRWCVDRSHERQLIMYENAVHCIISWTLSPVWMNSPGACVILLGIQHIFLVSFADLVSGDNSTRVCDSLLGIKHTFFYSSSTCLGFFKFADFWIRTRALVPPVGISHISLFQLVGDFLAAGVDTRYTRQEITKIDTLKNSLTMKSFQVKECVTGMRQKTGGVRRRQDI